MTTNQEMIMSLLTALRRTMWIAPIGLALSLLLGAASPAQVPKTRLLIVGSTTMGPLLEAIGARYQRLHPDVRIEVQLGGSGRGASDTRQGKADIGMVSRAIGETDNDLYGIPIARDGVAAVVHKSNPVNTLSHRQLADIYSGKVTNWRQLGGQDGPIRVLAGPAEGGSSELFAHYLQIPYKKLIVQQVLVANADRIDAVAADPLAIVYVSVGEAERKVQGGQTIKLLAIDGTSATSANVRSSNYPMSRPLTLVSRGVPTGLAKGFIEYCVTSQVTDLIINYDFIPYLD
jgi:phosphate transport system substrate-binding protein